LKMPHKSGLEALSDLKEVYKGKTLLFTAEIQPSQIVEAIHLGAHGVVFKDAATRLLIESVRTVMAGGYWVGTQSVPNLLEYLQSEIKEANRKKFGLTARELEIVSTVVAGLSNKEIAQHFKLSEDTVKHHLSNIFDKLGVSTRLELALFAVNHKLPFKDISWFFAAPDQAAALPEGEIPAQANRLAWLFDWPKAEPLYARAQERLTEKGDSRNEVYARIGRIRARSETMSYVDASQMIDKEIARPVTKSDPKLNAIPHIMTRRFISLIHRAAEPPYRSKTGTHFA
jgi:two-component system, NarL family, nitrate/nitrite response regulator NarL